MVEIGSWTRDLCLGDPISLPLHHEVTPSPIFQLQIRSKSARMWSVELKEGGSEKHYKHFDLKDTDECGLCTQKNCTWVTPGNGCKTQVTQVHLLEPLQEKRRNLYGFTGVVQKMYLSDSRKKHLASIYCSGSCTIFLGVVAKFCWETLSHIRAIMFRIRDENLNLLSQQIIDFLQL